MRNTLLEQSSYRKSTREEDDIHNELQKNLRDIRKDIISNKAALREEIREIMEEEMTKLRLHISCCLNQQSRILTTLNSTSMDSRTSLLMPPPPSYMPPQFVSASASPTPSNCHLSSQSFHMSRPHYEQPQHNAPSPPPPLPPPLPPMNLGTAAEDDESTPPSSPDNQLARTQQKKQSNIPVRHVITVQALENQKKKLKKLRE
ncbi:actin-binding protein WASF2-like [Adelges cooleyi]|uniref:actin-binding protein WASF2-like n=1 Tax=Adelges cooleyi TaxID=133065 RepID=UPI00217FD760|nr:actin-binding protein WASF2-like [Adelges cooleyi]